MQDFRKPSVRGKAQAQSKPSRTPQARIDIRELVGHHRQITISHGGDDYALRITRNEELISTK
jgi:hemin uptake protein HemP